MTRVDTYNHLWLKTQAAIKAIHHSTSEYDFFFKADDDTFAVLPNMRKLLATHSPKEPVMFGKLISDYCPPGFLSGGAGYVLSHESFRRIVEQGIDKHPACLTKEVDMEDVRICRCARALGIDMVEPKGRFQRPLFFHMFPKWIYGDNANSVNQIFNSPNITTSNGERLHIPYNPDQISFHYIQPAQLYIIEFLLYFLHPVGLN
ncbi:glycoprotein-N-acetylgalactosamine 3-beta-galactosyltransferase 1 [Clonorchis sinensis]|nr:glycoprotein-N-acetylgalactosamine 3-beta-galactosyltransferase 1 [Clonorchis sinensis]